MKYTNNDIKVGTIFGYRTYRWEITAVKGDKCAFYRTDEEDVKRTDYSIRIIVNSLNDGSWQLYNIKIPEYEIY